MTKEDIDNIIRVICSNDEDFEKPIISPAYLKKELEALALEQEPSGDLINRQAVLNTLDRMDKALDTDRTVESYKELLTECYKDLPPANPQEPKYCDRNICIKNEYNGIGCDECEVTKSQELKILDTLDFAITASNGDTNYFVGFRNGLRYAKSLIDGEENPQFESCTEQEPCKDCRNCKKWGDCECGRKGHINGTSIGYSIGECKDYESQESEE